MLVIQKIDLEWYKEARGHKPAEVRSRFAKAYRIPTTDITAEYKDILFHHLFFLQRGIHIISRASSIKNRYSHVSLPNLNISFENDNLRVKFSHDGSTGNPFRRGHNEDFNNVDSPFYRKDFLNETAFVLCPEEYGRLIYNERKVVAFEGDWYYQLHIVNFICIEKQNLRPTIFTSKKPDKVYQNLASLF